MGLTIWNAHASDRYVGDQHFHQGLALLNNKLDLVDFPELLIVIENKKCTK